MAQHLDFIDKEKEKKEKIIAEVKNRLYEKDKNSQYFYLIKPTIEMYEQVKKEFEEEEKNEAMNKKKRIPVAAGIHV